MSDEAIYLHRVHISYLKLLVFESVAFTPELGCDLAPSVGSTSVSSFKISIK